ncbi:MAG: Zn-dependent hydrolase [Bacteroidetes bacterium]|nr:MAG: Zn-dependent hydrolase [Bacteroidota bacterium]
MLKTKIFSVGILMILFITGCNPEAARYREQLNERIAQYEEVTLTADLSWLSEAEREMIPILINAAEIIDEIFWLQAYGPREHLKEHMDEPLAWDYALINYGPWGRLEGHTPFYHGFEDKPLGARFYPADMDRAEFDQWDEPAKNSPYTLIRRNTDGELIAVPYAEAFADKNTKISELLKEAAEISDYEPFARYLRELSVAILTDDYRESDRAWMQMKANNIDLVMRPLSTGEDRKFGYKAAHSTYLVVKDPEWSQRLERFSGMAQQLQQRLPVPEQYKQETPGDDSEIFVYDALYYAGHCNAGPKIIALHLPQDSEIASETGTRSMQLKNVMDAKFSEILLPIADMIMDEEQRDYISSDAFFLLTAFHEIAASLGISNTVDGRGTVRDALMEYDGLIDATVTDLMALYLIAQLHEMGELSEEELRDAYTTSFASVMRSSRFGTAGAHGIAGMIRFNYFEKEQVFQRDAQTQTYRIDVEKMKDTVEKALAELMIIQGNGDYEAAREIATRLGSMPESLQADIDRINDANIPVDVAFKQGVEYLGL